LRCVVFRPAKVERKGASGTMYGTVVGILNTVKRSISGGGPTEGPTGGCVTGRDRGTYWGMLLRDLGRTGGGLIEEDEGGGSHHATRDVEAPLLSSGQASDCKAARQVPAHLSISAPAIRHVGASSFPRGYISRCKGPLPFTNETIQITWSPSLPSSQRRPFSRKKSHYSSGNFSRKRPVWHKQPSPNPTLL
jgi:hypothetical protein